MLEPSVIVGNPLKGGHATDAIGIVNAICRSGSGDQSQSIMGATEMRRSNSLIYKNFFGNYRLLNALDQYNTRRRPNVSHTFDFIAF